MTPITSTQTATSMERKTFPQVAKWMDTVMDVVLHGTVLLIPLFFTSVSIDSLELPKQTLLIFLAAIGFMAWLAKGVAMKSLSLHRSWLHIVVVLFVAMFALVAWMSPDRYLSFVGSLGQMPWSVATMVALLALYLVAVNRLRSVAQVYDLIFTFLIASALAGLYGLCQMLGWYMLPSDIAKAKTFTTVGSIYSLSVFLVTPLIIASGLAFHGCRNNVCVLGSSTPMGRFARVLVWVTIVISLVDLIVIDYWIAWVALLFGTALTVGVGLVRGMKTNHPAKFAIPAVLVLVSALLLWQPTPFKLDLPAEVSPSASASWNIAQQALRDHPLFGMGPGTWTYSYAQYRDRSVNLSPFWNVRFDRSFSQFLTLLASVGIVGITLWILFLVSVIVKSASQLVEERNDDTWYAVVMIFSGWAALTFASFFYNFNVAHITMFWMLSAFLASMAGGSMWTWDAKRSPYAFEGISTLFVLGLVAAVASLWFFGQRFVADVAFSSGVSAFRAGQPVEEVIKSLERARRMNPSVDTYARNLSQAHLIKAANLIQNKPTEEQAAIIQNEIRASVDLALSASTTNPANVDNFSNLAVIYESIASFTRGADEASIAAYREALRREPNNPVFMGEVGKLYLLRADAYRTALNQGDAAAQAEARKNVDANLETAVRVLTQATEVKPDYLPARYYLGIAFERQGKLRESIQQLATILQQNRNDSNVAFELSLLLYRDNQKPAAVALMQEVVNVDGENANAKWYLSAMYEEQGKTEDALSLLRYLAARFPDNQAIQQRIAALQSVRPSGSALPEPVVEPIKGSLDSNPVTR